MISVCITCQNRSRLETEDGLSLTLLPNCIDSILKLREDIEEDIEIVISDFESDDWPLEDWMPDKLNNVVPYKLVEVKGKFSRGKGRNIAFRHSRGDKILFLDADMMVDDPLLFLHGIEAIDLGAAYFPICYSYYNHQMKDGWWRTTGFGNLMVSRDDFNGTNGWEEKYSWGGEDDKIFLTLARSVPIIREKVLGFYHQWHPDSPRREKNKSWFKRLFSRK